MEHPSRASRFASGEYVVLSDSLHANATVWFAFEPDRWEGVVAVRDAPDRARLAGVPLWTYGANLGDVVELVESSEGAPVVVRVVEPSSNRTFRVVFGDLERGDTDDRWRGLLADLEPHECWFDVLSPGYLALSASPDAFEAVQSYLQLRAEKGDFVYERADGDRRPRVVRPLGADGDR